MNCNSNVNEQFRKSVLVSVDDVGQIIDTANEESLLLGQVVYQSGTALELSESYHRIKRKGLYRADASVVFVPRMMASSQFECYLVDICFHRLRHVLM